MDELQVGIVLVPTIGPAANMVDMEVLAIRQPGATVWAETVLAASQPLLTRRQRAQRAVLAFAPIVAEPRIIR